MFNEFDYRLRFNPLFKSLCMKFEGEGGGEGGSEGGEEDTGGGGEGGGENESWLDAHELSDEDKETHSKYETVSEALKGGANAIRQVGKSVRFPDDTTSDEDKVNFDTKVAEYQKVPKEAKDYVLNRPKELPAGMVWDEDMETWFRDGITKVKCPQAIAQQLFDGYCERMIGQHNIYQEVAKDSEKELREELKNDFDAWFGDPKDKESIGTIKQTVLQLSKDLKLDYTDEKDGSPQSKLADCLELKRHNGCLGDMTPILKVLNFIHKTYYAEGATLSGDLTGIKDEKGKSVFDFDDMNDKDESGDYGLS